VDRVDISRWDPCDRRTLSTADSTRSLGFGGSCFLKRFSYRLHEHDSCVNDYSCPVPIFDGTTDRKGNWGQWEMCGADEKESKNK